MTRYLIGTALLALTACGGDSAPEANEAATVSETPPPVEQPAAVVEPVATDGPAYGPEWDVSEYWPGEYPAGFSVIEEGVILPARAEMDPRAPRDLACPLPRLATYHVWNAERVAADNVRFFTASRIRDVPITRDIEIATFVGDAPATLSLKSGDSVRYLRYLSEGYAVIEKDGIIYEISESELYPDGQYGDWPDSGAQTQLWMQLDCADDARTRAWLMYDEVEGTRGTIDAPITGYGEAIDLGEILE